MREITKEEWKKIHKDYKTVINGGPYIMVLEKGVTCLVPVKIKNESEVMKDEVKTHRG